MTMNAMVTQRDLRYKSREIMDAVKSGQSFIITQNGHQIGELIPLRHPRRLVPREAFMAMSHNVPDISIDAFRADQDSAFDHEMSNPYDQ